MLLLCSVNMLLSNVSQFKQDVLTRYLIQLYLLKNEFIADFLKEAFLKISQPPPPMFLAKLLNYSKQLVQKNNPGQLLLYCIFYYVRLIDEVIMSKACVRYFLSNFYFSPHCKFQILQETNFLTQILKMRDLLLIMRKLKQKPR